MTVNSAFIDDVIDRISRTLGDHDSTINLHEPRFQGNEKKYLNDCIDSTFVSSVGKYVDLFEAYLASYTGAKYAIAVVNGTAALHLSLKVAGVEDGDEVLVPALTFVATANAVAYCNAIPHFVDIEEGTLGVDATALDEWLSKISTIRQGQLYNSITKRRIKALLIMHTFGHPCNIDGLLSVARKYGVTLIEDSAESFGSFYKGRHTGTFGLMGTLSFNGNKIITTGGGGAILTNDQKIAVQLKHLSTTAKISHPWEYVHDQIGYNYRMPNLNAALGLAQLEQLDSFISSKRSLYAAYEMQFKNLKGIQLFREPEHCRSNYWFQSLLLQNEYAQYKSDILKRTNQSGFMTRPAWALMNKLPPYTLNPCAPLPIAENIIDRLINIPSSAGLV